MKETDLEAWKAKLVRRPHKGCLACGLNPICKIKEDLEQIQVRYNVYGAELLKSAQLWCTYKENFIFNQTLKPREGAEK